MNSPVARIRRALFSLSDKRDAVELAQALHAGGTELLATGGTFKILCEAGLPVREVAEHTGFPEILDGRLKTLHPRIHGGILARREIDDETLARHDIPPIDLVAVNLYPFAQSVARPDCTFEEALENIDIGGPTLLRAAAKNHDRVTVLSSPEQYASVLHELQEKGEISATTRSRLAGDAFRHTATYDAMIAQWFEAQTSDHRNDFPVYFSPLFERHQMLRYGENPHQRAAFYTETHKQQNNIACARQLQGKSLSYNNIADADAALQSVFSLEQPACVIVKHANPCGAAQAASPLAAYEMAHATDPESAFGGIVAFNCTLDDTTAQAILQRQFVEVILAAEITPKAREILKTKPAIRAFQCENSASGPTPRSTSGMHYQRVDGGLLVQDKDDMQIDHKELRTVTRQNVEDEMLKDLLFAWRIVGFVKSNAIVFAGQQRSLGIGAGQMSRVHSVRIAVWKAAAANLSLQGSVMASDAFFPFRDGIDAAAEHGVRAVIQPGGSKRDGEVIAAADEHGIAMIFTGMRHFRH